MKEKINYFQAYERVKIEEYKKYYSAKGFEIFNENQDFDLIVKNPLSGEVIVFEFKNGSNESRKEIDLENLKNRVKQIDINARLELVYCVPEIEEKSVIDIPWLSIYLTQQIERYKVKEIKEQIPSFFQLIDRVHTILVGKFEWLPNKITISGSAYINYEVDALIKNKLNRIIPDPLFFDFKLEIKATTKFYSYISTQLNSENATEIKINYESL